MRKSNPTSCPVLGDYPTGERKGEKKREERKRDRRREGGKERIRE